jgi:hypothetical protein
VKTPEELWPELEALGEGEVHRRYAAAAWGPTNAPLVEEWLRRKDAQRTRKRQDEALYWANKANQIARDANQRATAANRIAWIAVLLAAASLISTLVRS